MKYAIHQASSAKILVEIVTDHIKAGWIPVGGVSVSDWVYTERMDGRDEENLASRFAQAMILKEDGDK